MDIQGIVWPGSRTDNYNRMRHRYYNTTTTWGLKLSGFQNELNTTN
jgi:hypothetical protein